MNKLDVEYYMIDELNNAERVLIRSASEINTKWIRNWYEISPVFILHVFGCKQKLKWLQGNCIRMGDCKTVPVELTTRFISNDCLEIRKSFGRDWSC